MNTSSNIGPILSVIYERLKHSIVYRAAYWWGKSCGCYKRCPIGIRVQEPINTLGNIDYAKRVIFLFYPASNRRIQHYLKWCGHSTPPDMFCATSIIQKK